MPYSCVAKSDIGQVRAENEDFFLACSELNLWVVADGMGGHKNGKLASRLACETIVEQVAKQMPVLKAIHYAHKVILDSARMTPANHGMGTTVVVLQAHKNTAKIWWVGDSRAYLLKDHVLSQVTHDHSWVQRLVDAGHLPSSAIETHPKKHVITQSLGMSSKLPLDIGYIETSIDENTQILLCSDGLSNELSSQEIRDILCVNDTQEARVNTLIDAANHRRGRDNITALLVKFTQT